MEDYDQTMYLM